MIEVLLTFWVIMSAAFISRQDEDDEVCCVIAIGWGGRNCSSSNQSKFVRLIGPCCINSDDCCPGETCLTRTYEDTICGVWGQKNLTVNFTLPCADERPFPRVKIV